MTAARMRLVDEMRFPGRPEILRDVRTYVARRLVMELPEAADDSRLLDDLRLLVAELSANAIKHTVSGRWRRGSFEVRMWLGANHIRMEVRDQGWWSGPRIRNDPDEIGGRGLRLVAAMATWGVSRRWFGRVVWFEIPIEKGCAA
ncbi:ATP-binding protein [Nonomuraea sp. NPDC050404]|uniref:ATP-binding protein n=1 Tax=Nonomuraea sp. NPDC050404 TaxID=3155783 RepID=UPI0033D7FBC7